MEEPEEQHASQSFDPVPTATTTPFSKIDNTVTTEGMGVLQKALFLAVILGCIAVYLRISKAKGTKDQVYEKSLA